MAPVRLELPLLHVKQDFNQLIRLQLVVIVLMAQRNATPTHFRESSCLPLCTMNNERIAPRLHSNGVCRWWSGSTPRVRWDSSVNYCIENEMLEGLAFTCEWKKKSGRKDIQTRI